MKSDTATVEKAVSLLEPGGRLQIGDQFLHVDLPRERARFPYLPRVLETCRRLGLERYCQCDISRAAYRMTSSCLAELRRRRAELIAAHSQRRPEIGKDIDDMLSCGTLEYDAYRAGHLSYQILTFDRPA